MVRVVGQRFRAKLSVGSCALVAILWIGYGHYAALSWYTCGICMTKMYFQLNFPSPAKVWESPGPVDVYDCRKRSWYIETATCSKDIVILLDNSGSMTGFRNYIAQLTVKSVLDTFSNNDFINIYNYSESVRELVPCFNVKRILISI